MMRCPLIIFLCCIFFSYSAEAQTDTPFIARCITAIGNNSSTRPVEKVYLHLSRPYYTPGSTIWFKAYTVIGEHHQLSTLSGVLYTELIDPNDSVILRETLRLTSGVAWSDISLPGTISAGNYRLRAYTNWMRNFGSTYFYDQPVIIAGIVTDSVKTIAPVNPDVQFFPEGGELVDGIRSRVAVKAVGGDGLGIDVYGSVNDNDGNEVAQFKITHLGMGIFAFTPQAGKTYKAIIKGAGNTTFSKDLPVAKDEGYTLTVYNTNPDSVFIKITVNGKAFTTLKNSTFYVVAQSAGIIYYAGKGILRGLSYTSGTSKSRFPSGITQITLFDQNRQPINERLIFIQNNDTLSLTVPGLLSTYANRQNMKINLQAKDNTGKPATGSFSIAVINESKVVTDENNDGTIISNLLLTSDLKGYVEQPNYYFTNINTQTKANLDLLMLTQGYRRLEWKKLLYSKDSSVTFPTQHGLELHGIIKTPGGKPVPGGQITLLAMKDNVAINATADGNGNFKFMDINLPDTAKILLRAIKQNDSKNVMISVKKPDYPPVDFVNTPTINILTGQAGYDENTNSNGSKASKPLDTLTESKITVSKSSTTKYFINVDKLASQYNYMKDALENGVPGMTYVNDKLRYNNEPVTIIIDGLNRGKAAADYQPMAQVEKMRIIEKSVNRHAVLLITTKKDGSGDNYLSSDPKGIINYTFDGYYRAKSFYMPKYDVKSSKKADMRNTIFWDPNIITDKDGNATISYFNNDTKGTYRVVIEGIDESGNLGRRVYHYKVE